MNNPFQLPELFTLSGVRVASPDTPDTGFNAASCTTGGGCSSGGGCGSGGATQLDNV